jgi:hypothetical protein
MTSHDVFPRLSWPKRGLAAAAATVVLLWPAQASPVALLPFGKDIEEAPWIACRPEEQEETDAAAPLEFRMTTDGTSLFVEAKMRVTKETPQVSQEETGERAPLPADSDAIEIFIAPHGPESPSYYLFGLDISGQGYDTMAGLEEVDFTSGWVHEVDRRADHWIARLTIPAAGIDRAEGFAPGDLIGFNLVRTSGTARGPRRQSWGPDGDSAADPRPSGQIVAGSFAVAAKRALDAVAVGAKLMPPAWTEQFDALRSLAETVRTPGEWIDFAARAEALGREAGQRVLAHDKLVAWQVNPWKLPASDELPQPSDKPADRLALQLFQQESQPVAVAFAYAGPRAMAMLRVVAGRINRKSLETRRGPVLDRHLTHRETGATAPLDQHLEFFEVQEIQTSGLIVRDILQRLRYEQAIPVPKGANGILWMQVTAGDLAPGVWTTELEIRPMAEQDLVRRIPVEIEVLPAAIPTSPHPYGYGWVSSPHRQGDIWGFFGGRSPFTYPTEDLVGLMKRFGMNVIEVDRYYLNLDSISYDENGRLVAGPDLSRVDELIKDFGPDALYVFLLRYERLPVELGGGGEPGELQRQNHAAFIEHVRRFLEERGIGRKNFAWYVEDEVSGGIKEERTITHAKLIRDADPDQQVFVTIYSNADVGVFKSLAPHVNLWVPKFNLSPEQQAVLDAADRSETRFLSYMVQGRAADPYRGIRSMGLDAFKRGYEGIGLWSFGGFPPHYGTSLFHDEPGIKKYALIYEGENHPVFSVRLMAWLAAIQDYKIFSWARSLAEEHPTATEAAAINHRLRRLDGDWWAHSPSRLDETVDALRPMILAILSAKPPAPASTD